MKFSNRVIELSNKLQQISFIRAIRDGLVSMIPVLIIGAFSLILQTFPVVAYQNFINNFADGLLLKLFNFVYTATFGVLSVYLTFCISKSYMKIRADLEMVHSGAILCSIVELSLSLNMSVLAEFVETEEEKELLHELGCDNYQGFLYSKAEPL